nr:GDSL-type esterase/lipase family protein [uncultured Clostridium sp.]
MPKRIHKVVLDSNKSTSLFEINKLDSLHLEVEVTEVETLENAEVELFFKKSDGTLVSEIISEKEQNILKIDVKNGALDVPGIVVGQAKITEEDGNISSHMFKFNIKNSITSDDAIVNEIGIGAIEELKKQIGNAQIDPEVLKNKIEETINNGDLDVVSKEELQEINSQLDNKTTELDNKINEVATTGTTTEAVQSKVEEMAEQGLIQAYTLGDNTVEPKKTTFFNEHKGRNLLKPNNIDFGTWLGNNTGGTTATKEPSANGGWNSFRAIEIEPNKDYVFLINGAFFTGSNANYSYWYDADGNAISMFEFAGVVTSPSNAKYVRASFKGATTSKYGVYQASGVVAHEDYIEPYYTFDISYLPKEEDNRKKTKNLFDEGAITLDSYLPGGNLSGNSNGWKVSDFIEVKPNTDYILSQQYSIYTFNSNYCWFYDENKSVISNITSNPFTTPANCKYVRFSIQNQVTYMQLEEGTEIGYYIPYGYEEDYRELLKSPLLGKKYCPIGDSITASGWGYELARQTGMVVNNYNAIGGTTVSGAYDGTTNMCGTTRIQATPSDTEIITIMGGSNDWSQQSQGSGIPLGDMTDIKIGEDKVLDRITFTGCYKLMLNRLYRQCPNAQIFILEQTYRYLEDTDRAIPLDDFRKRTLEIAYEYGYPVIHMKQKCGFNEMNYEDYYIDVIHPNGTTGRKRIIEVVKSGILSTIQ